MLFAFGEKRQQGENDLFIVYVFNVYCNIRDFTEFIHHQWRPILKREGERERERERERFNYL